MTTAFLTVLPSLVSAVSRSLARTMAEISAGENCFVSFKYSTCARRQCRSTHSEDGTNLDEGGALLVDNFEWPVDHILLDIRIVESSTNESLRVEDGLSGVHSGLVPGALQSVRVRRARERIANLAESPISRSVSVKAT